MTELGYPLVLPRRDLMKRRALAALANATIIAALLAGCATPETGLSVNASTRMQGSVVSIADAAAAGDLATATAQLDVLQKQLDRAIADGDVSAKRANAIQGAIDAVRADLVTALAETAAPAPAEPAPAEPAPTEPVAPGTGRTWSRRQRTATTVRTIPELGTTATETGTATTGTGTGRTNSGVGWPCDGRMPDERRGGALVC